MGDPVYFYIYILYTNRILLCDVVFFPGKLPLFRIIGGQALLNSFPIGTLDRGFIGSHRSFISDRTLFEMLGMFHRFHKRHVDVEKLIQGSRSRTGFGDMAVNGFP